MGTLCEDLCKLMVISHWMLLRMRNTSDKSCREKQNTHFMSKAFFLKIVPFMRKFRVVEPGGGHRLQHNAVHAYCVLDNLGYIYALRICNTYWFYRQQWF
jgi:hypothetical protein